MSKKKKKREKNELKPAGGSTLLHDNPMYAGGNDDDMLINAILAGNAKEPEKAENLVLNLVSEEANKTCPVCGAPLIGRNNYCMGCGKNVNPRENEKGSSGDGRYDSSYMIGAGYGGGNAYVEREEALKRRREKNKDITKEVGLAGLLLKVLGVLLGFIIGYVALKSMFVPKEAEVTLYREVRVTAIAKINSIAAGTKSIPSTVVSDNKDDRAKESLQGKGSTQSTAQAANTSALIRKRNQNFYGTLIIYAENDKIYEMEDEEVWDIRGLDPYDVIYVINNLEYQFAGLSNYIFIQYELEQEEEQVVLHFRYQNLNIAGNVQDMISLGILGEDAVGGKPGKEYFSMQKTKNSLIKQGWKMEMPVAMITPSPSPTAATEEVTETTKTQAD